MRSLYDLLLADGQPLPGALPVLDHVLRAKRDVEAADVDENPGDVVLDPVPQGGHLRRMFEVSRVSVSGSNLPVACCDVGDDLR